jgi:CheY-like chemotaxis protein
MDSQFATKIMLVDDEEEFIDLLSQRLETRGLKVIAVTSGEEAVAAAEDRNIDVAVVDLAMPGIDGIETLRQVKAKRPDIEIIMLTGHATIPLTHCNFVRGLLAKARTGEVRLEFEGECAGSYKSLEDKRSVSWNSNK